jgi:integrase
MRQKSEETVVVKENAIRLVRRADSQYWQAHYKIDQLSKWIRKATKKKDIAQARNVAEELWLEAKILTKNGQAVVSKRFKAVADIVLTDLEIKIQADRTRRGSNNDYINAIKKYLIPFFGNYNVNTITQEVFTKFCEWRREQVGRELSHSAQANHNAALNLVFDLAIERGYMVNSQRPALKNTGAAAGRRPDFSSREIEQLLTYLPGWVENSRAGRTRMIRELLAIYVPFAATTGMRTGTEMEFLEWRHIEVHEIAGEPVLYANIQRGKTVKKNSRQGAVLHRSCWLYLEKLRQLAPELRDKTLNQVLQEQHALRLFRMSDGKQPETFAKQFKQLMEDSELLICPVTGEERTLYSLRHYAITQLVTKGLTAEQIQQQVRTSATMIAKHYNHLNPLLNADKFSGRGDTSTDEDAITRIINQSPNDNLIHFAELSTGLSLALIMQNPDVTRELQDALRGTRGAKPN